MSHGRDPSQPCEAKHSPAPADALCLDSCHCVSPSLPSPIPILYYHYDLIYDYPAYSVLPFLKEYYCRLAGRYMRHGTRLSTHGVDTKSRRVKSEDRQDIGLVSRLSLASKLSIAHRQPCAVASALATPSIRAICFRPLDCT